MAQSLISAVTSFEPTHFQGHIELFCHVLFKAYEIIITEISKVCL